MDRHGWIERRERGGLLPIKGGINEIRQAGILAHEGQTIFRIVGIERNVCGSGLQDGEKRGNQSRRAMEADSNTGFRANTLGRQIVGQLVGAGIQVGIGKMLAFKHQRNVFRRALNLLLKQLMQAIWNRIGSFVVVPIDGAVADVQRR